MAVVAGDWVIRHIGDWARRHTQLNSTLAKLTKNHEKWTVGRGVVSGYVAPVAQNPAYSPPQPGGAEPPRRSVVGALARPARARAMRRRDWRVRRSRSTAAAQNRRYCPCSSTTAGVAKAMGPAMAVMITER
jgi:hypothetical protein